MNTESRNPRSFGLDRMSAIEMVRLMNEEEQIVFRAVSQAAGRLAEAALKVAETYENGGNVLYVGAGTSGRIAAADAAEMPPTFGTEPHRFQALIAGGTAAVDRAIEAAEDDEHAAVDAINSLDLSRKDAVIGLTASGKTPFVVAAIRHAKAKGIWTCGIANAKSAALLAVADLPILLETGPEVLTGSTRLKAGTAQKMALNRISTAAMVLTGKVIENLMVDVKATNHKLQERCARIVRDLSTVTEEEAYELLAAHGWNVRRVLEILRPTPVRIG